MERQLNSLRLGVILAIVIALGAYTIGPAIGALSKKTAAKTFLKKKTAKKKFLKKKAANNKYLKKVAAGEQYLGKTEAEDTYLKKADADFATPGQSYSKAESDTKYAPASQEIEVSVPPSNWYSDPTVNNSMVGTERRVFKTTFPFNGAGTALNQIFFAHVPLAIAGPATVTGIELCFVLGLDTSIDSLALIKLHATAAEPDPDGSTFVLDGSAVGVGLSTCKTFTAADAPGEIVLDPSDTVGLVLQADFNDSGAEAFFHVTRANVTIET